ncbi:nudix (nucleoside diphosphate linked moiety X)-type motif 2 [Thoreauomyces humboldtii]|nr:nudix (nucleoside diphosphate linked moiety X)-type motif 2 [Thoreauomyces humboldtii]
MIASGKMHKHRTPPKGKLIGQENEQKCALRVVPDVIGLNIKDISIDEGFRAEIKYISNNKPKRCVFFLAHLTTRNVRIESGGLGGMNIEWMPATKASDKALYRNMQDVISEAASFAGKLKALNMAAAAAQQQQQQQTNSPSSNGSRTPQGNRRNLPRDAEKSNHSGSDEDQRRPNTGARGRPPVAEARPSHFGAHADSSWREPPPRNIDVNRVAEDVGRAARSPSSHNSNNPLFRTRLCERFETEGDCPYGTRCTFAHGAAELRTPPPGPENTAQHKDVTQSAFYKTRLCERFATEVWGPASMVLAAVMHMAKASFASDRNSSRSSNNLNSIKHCHHLITATGKTNKRILPLTFRVSRQPGEGRMGTMDLDKPWIRVSQIPESPSRTSTPPPNPSNVTANATSSTAHPADRNPAAALEATLTASLSETLLSNRLSHSDEIKELTRLEFKHDLTKRQVFAILFGALVADGTYQSPRIRERADLFRQVVRTRADQTALIRAVGGKCTTNGEAVLGKILVVLKDLYDMDLVEEDVMLEWFDSIPPDSHVKGRVEPFVKWLRTAEEED